MITTTQNGPISVMSLVPADFPPIHDPSVFSLFQNSSLSLQFHCQGLGFSVIDSSPEECCYLFLDQIDAKAVVTEESQELLMNIACFQIDVSDYDAPVSTTRSRLTRPRSMCMQFCCRRCRFPHT